jgi:hypothetical protein
VVLFALACLPGAAYAQADSSGEVSGVVYDSVARQSLRGAVVQLVAPQGARPFSAAATTDARGRYLLSGVRPGTYVVGFQHRALDTLALTSPLRPVVVRSGERVDVDLAVPSPATIAREICGDMSRDTLGLVFGVIRDARSGLPIDSGVASASWEEITISAGGIRRRMRRAQSMVNAAGWFALCRVPANVDLALGAWSGVDTSGAVVVSVARNGIIRRDISLGGTATVRGFVVSDEARPIAAARVVVAGRGKSTTTDSTGAFVFGLVHAGAQTLEARALGFAPVSLTLHLRGDQDTTINVTLTSVRKVLDTLHVYAQRVYNRDSNGFERRRRIGAGFSLSDEDIALRQPYDAYSLLNEVPVLNISYGGGTQTPNSAFDRIVLMRGAGPSAVCVPMLWLDGTRMPNMLDQIDMLVRPDEIAGIEVYRPGQVPPEFAAGYVSCGVIVIWTKPLIRPLPRP